MRARSDDAGPDDFDCRGCEICGLEPGLCVCPECPVCGVYGDPKCYEVHGLVAGDDDEPKETAMFTVRTTLETWMRLGPELVRLGCDAVEITDREPDPHYPQCDLDDLGPQDGVWWAHNQFDDDTALGSRAVHNKYVLPLAVFDLLAGGSEKERFYSRRGHMVYPDVPAAATALNAAAFAWAKAGATKEAV